MKIKLELLLLITLIMIGLGKKFPEQRKSIVNIILTQYNTSKDTYNILQNKMSDHAGFYMRDEIKKSTFLLKYKKSHGSGIAVEYKNKKFILTNSHVCLGKLQSQVEQNQKYVDTQISMMLDNDDILVGDYTYYIKDVYFDASNDLCILPYKDILRSVSFFKVDDYKMIRKLIQPNEKIALVTGNNLKNISFKYGNILSETSFVSFCDIGVMKTKSLTSLKSYYCKRKKEHYNVTSTDIKVIPGDSGSPVFNSKYELIGLGFATQFKSRRNYARAKRLGIRAIKELTIKQGYITNKDEFKIFLNRAITFLNR